MDELIIVDTNQKECIQKLEMKILKEIDRICRKYNIKYMIAYGSLIGAIRHDGFIPWDDDIDICMVRKDYKRFKIICKKEFGNNKEESEYFYQSNDTDPEYFYLFDKIRLNKTVFKESFVSKYNINHGIYVDIFPVDRVPQNKIVRLIHYLRVHFYRTGVMAKYPMLKYRDKKKKIIFGVLRIVYYFIPLHYMYERAQKIAEKYNTTDSKLLGSLFSSYHMRDIFAEDIYTDLIEHGFEDSIVFIPKKYDSYLTQLYGDYMTLPPENQRITRHSLTELKLK